MTDSHRELGQHWLDNAIDWYSQIEDSDPWEKTTASALIAGVFFLAARDDATLPWDDDLAGEEQHQSEKFESTVELGGQTMTEAQFHAARFPLLNPDPGPAIWPELDEDNPDTLVGDAGFEDDADTIARPLSPFGRMDFYGQTTPWGAA